MANFDLKLFEKAILNVRAKIVKGEFGAHPMYKKAADTYARMFELHQQQVSISKQMQKLDEQQQNLANEVMRSQGAMEVMEGVLAEDLLNTGADLQELSMQDVAKIAGEQIKAKQAMPPAGAEPKDIPQP
jgi:lipid II:glycine glycyltransferase (peptidoglycan interpeptide bridge formation enzyme)